MEPGQTDGQTPTPEDLAEAIRQMQVRLDRLEEVVRSLPPALIRGTARPAVPPTPERAAPSAVASEPPAPTPPPVLRPMAAVQAAPPAEAPAPSPIPAPAATTTPPAEAPAVAPAPAGPLPPSPASTPAPAQPRAPRPARSFEQRLGTRWLLFVGVGVLLLGGFFFFKYAIERGWISPTLRALAGAAGGLAMIALGEWTLLRQKMRLFAAGVMGGGIVLLYFVVFLASPNGWYHLIGPTSAFVLMCAVTALGMGLSLQTAMPSTSVVALIGAFATPVLLSTGENRQVLLMCYLLVVNAGFLAVGLLKRWWGLGPLALAGTAIVFAGWYASHGPASPWGGTLLFGWLLLAEFAGFAFLADRKKQMPAALVQVFLLAAGSIVLALWLVMFRGLPTGAFLACVGGLAAAGLALGVWRGWRGLCAVAVGWSAVGLTWQPACGADQQAMLLGALLALDAAVLVAALIRKWPQHALLALGQAVVVVGTWRAVHYQPAAWSATTTFGWLLLAEFVAYACAVAWKRLMDEAWAHGTLFLAGSAALGLWITLLATMPAGAYIACVAALTAVGLVVSVWRDGRALCVAAAAWSMVGLMWQPACGANEQGLLMGSLLALNVGLLAAALIRTWPEQALLALAQVAVVVGVWYTAHFQPAAWGATNTFAWLLLGEILLAACAGAVARRLESRIAQTLIAGAGTAATVLWLDMMPSMPQAWFLGGLLALVVIVLAVGLWRDWPPLSAAAFVWSAAAMLAQVLYRYDPALDSPERWRLAVWMWAFFAAISADVFLRAFRKGKPMPEYLYAALATLGMAGMFGGTYGLLRGPHAGWMGPYAAGLGAAAVAAAWLVRRRADRRRLAYAYLGQGLVLLALAVPIHFDHANVPIAWAVQGVVAMFIARRLRNVLLLVYSPAVLALALIHFSAYSLPHDPRMGETILTILGTPITFGLLLAWGLTAAFLAAAGTLRAGEPLFEDDGERVLAIVLTVAAALVLAMRSAWELPPTGATWGWLVLAAGLAAVGLWRRSEWLGAAGGAALLAVAAKWGLFDTLYLRAQFGPDSSLVPLVNWQFAAGLLAAAMLVAYAWLIRRRVDWGPWSPETISVGVGLFAAVAIVYAGSFEIDRYFSSGRARWDDPAQAKQTAYSIWWAAYAASLMAVGFVRSIRAPRYLALGLFALTLAKVFLVDMARVETVYRILSFVCLGTLLVAASWLYHRYFRDKLPA